MPTCIAAVNDGGYNLTTLVPAVGDPAVDGYFFSNSAPSDLNIEFEILCDADTGFYCNVTDSDSAFLIYTENLEIYQIVTPGEPMYVSTYLSANTVIKFEKLTITDVSSGGISGYIFQGYYPFPATPTPTPTNTNLPPQTATPTPFPSGTGPTPSPTLTNLPTHSPTPSPTPSRTSSPTPSPSRSSTPTPTLSASFTPSPTITPSNTPTPYPTKTPKPSQTPTPSPTTTSATGTPTITPSVTPSPTPSSTGATLTPMPTYTPAPTLTANNSFLYSFGYNFYGQLGNDSIVNSTSPTETVINTPVWNLLAESHGNSNAAIKDDGTLWVWGYNNIGNLGTNNTIGYSSPVQTSIGGSIWQHCSASIYNLAAINGYGNLFVAGSNAYGQLGLGNTTDTSSLVQTANFSTWKWATAGYQSMFAISTSGKLYAVGKNGYGQLGIGNYTNQSTWTAVAPSQTWLSLDNDSNFTLALRSDGTVWAWGSNGAGQLGQNLNPVALPSSLTPLQVFTTNDWTAVTAGYGTSYAIRGDGTLWAWGLNNSGQIGDSTTVNRSSPIQVGSDTTWSAIGAGLQFAVALKNDGTVWSWGRNDREQLGNISASGNQSSPMQVITPGLVWASLSVGLNSTSILTDLTPAPTASVTPTPTETPTVTPSPTPSGTGATPSPTPTMPVGYYLAVWGDNTFGQLGSNTSVTSSNTPIQTIKNTDMWQGAAYGTRMGAGFDIYGNLWTFGNNGYGSLGNNKTQGNISSPVQVVGGGYYIEAVVGTSCLALRNDNSLWSWGYNAYGQVGDGTVDWRSSPVQIAGSWSAIANSWFFSAAINSSGQLFLWGDNSAGQLATNSLDDNSSPVQVLGGGTWTDVACGLHFAAAIKSDQSLWLWGDNSNGQLAQNNVDFTSSPVQEISGSSWLSVSCFADGTAAIKSDNTLWIWGANSYGQQGNNTTISASSPVQNGLGGNDWSAISCGLGHILATKNGNELWTWGYGASGQLGQGDFATSSYPTQLIIPGSDILLAAAGGYNSAVIYLGVATPTPSPSISPSPTPSVTPSPSPSVSPTLSPTPSASVTPTPTPSGTEATPLPSDTAATSTATPTPSESPTVTPSPSASITSTPTPSESLTPTPTPTGTSATSTPTASPSFSPTATPMPPTRLWLFGYNYFGQLGNNSTNDSINIVQTVYPLANWYTGCSSKTYATYALKEDNTLWSWGDNEFGQLCTNNVLYYSTPTQIYGGGSWSKVSGGVYHAAAIKNDGTLWSWGGNSYGCLGINVGFPAITSVSSPVQESTLSTWIAVAAGFDFTIGIKSNFTLWTWGSNLYNQIGDGRLNTLYPSRSSPVQEYYLATSWLKCAASAFSSAAIKQNGTLWTWGNGFYGQLGTNSTLNWTFPQPVDAPLPAPNWQELSAGFYHLAAIKGDRTLWLWGLNDRGQLGDGTTISRSSPVQVFGGGLWQAVSAGYNFTAAIKNDNTLWTWGANENDSLGNIGSINDQSSPCLFTTAGLRWYQVSAGMHHTALFTFNLNPTATPTLSPSSSATVTPTPTPTPTPTNAPLPSFIAVGGQLWLWGNNAYGQLGDDTQTNRSSAVQTVAAGSNWNVYSNRYTHASAVKDDGTLWVWGQNSYGGLGTNNTTNYSSPVQTITNTTDWYQPFGGNLFTLALKQNGSLWGWGKNDSGQLGQFNVTNYSSPVQILPAKTTGWLSVGCGSSHAAAVNVDGTLWCWGSNSYGQLGTNNTTDRSSPAQTIISGQDWAEVTCGENYTLALKKDGTIWGFGLNNYGQYGDTTQTSQSMPVLVAAGQAYWHAVSAGGQFAAALTVQLVPTPTNSPSPSVSPTPTPTPTSTAATPSPTISSTPSPTPTSTAATQTPTSTATVTPTPTPSTTAATPTPTASPTATYDPTRESALNIYYRIFSVFNKSLDIRYQLGALVTYAYRVETECRPLVQPLSPFTDESQKCEGRTIMTVFAKSVTDVCRQINASRYITKVNSIQKYTKPVYSLEEEYLIAKGEYDPRDVRYVDVPFCEYAACADLCVDYVMEENAYGTMYYNPPGSLILGGGSLNITGTGTAQQNVIIGNGSLGVSGYGVVLPGTSIQETYLYTGSGSVIINGNGSQTYPNFYIMLETASSNEFAEGFLAEQTVLVETTDSLPVLGVPTLQGNETVCGCRNIPLQLILNTNLTTSSIFTNFLNRNNLRFNPNLSATYNINTKEWIASYTYSSIYDSEKWLIAINLNCNNDLDDFDLEPIWTLTFLFRQIQANNKVFDTNLQVWIPASQLCSAGVNYRMSFNLAINVIANTCTINNNVVLPNLFLNDGASLFKSVGWNTTQILTISGVPAG